MNASPSSRKVYQGISDRRQMYRMFDRHAQRPNRFEGDATPLYAGEWFEIGEAEHDYMFEILPPLWIRGSMFAMREYLTGSVTSVFSHCASTARSVTSTGIAIFPIPARSSAYVLPSSSAKPGLFAR